MGLACKLIHTKNWGILDAPSAYDLPVEHKLLHCLQIHKLGTFSMVLLLTIGDLLTTGLCHSSHCRGAENGRTKLFSLNTLTTSFLNSSCLYCLIPYFSIKYIILPQPTKQSKTKQNNFCWVVILSVKKRV
jgi:hypothetical protein